MTDPPSDPLGHALEAFEEGQPDTALARLRAVPQGALSTKDQGRSVGLEIACMLELERDKDAETKIKQVCREQPGDEHFMLACGVQLSELECYEPAEEILRALCVVDRSSETPPYNLAVVLKRDKQYEQAAELFATAIERNERFEQAFLEKAECHEAIDEWADAAEAYRRYLALVPDDAHHWVSMAIALSNRERSDLAYEAYERAEKLEPESITLHYNWAITAVRKEDRERLSTCVQRLEEIAPADWRSAAARSRLLESDRQIWPAWEAALEAVDAALDDEDEDANETAEAAMSGALAFANRNGMQEHASGLIDRLFESRLFGGGTLPELRSLAGVRSPRAIRFYLVVEGRMKHDRVGDMEPVTPESIQGHGFYRSYQVLAEKEDEARGQALDFEARLGDGTGLRVTEVETMEGPQEADLGVDFCSDAMIFPVDEATDSG